MAHSEHLLLYRRRSEREKWNWLGFKPSLYKRNALGTEVASPLHERSGGAGNLPAIQRMYTCTNFEGMLRCLLMIGCISGDNRHEYSNPITQPIKMKITNLGQHTG